MYIEKGKLNIPKCKHGNTQE